jgi:hypothetical protein
MLERHVEALVRGVADGLRSVMERWLSGMVLSMQGRCRLLRGMVDLVPDTCLDLSMFYDIDSTAIVR